MVTIKRSPELEQFARERRRRLVAGDATWFEQTTADGEVTAFGTAPDEELRGREAVLAFTMKQIEQLETAEGLAAADADEPGGQIVDAYEAGDAGWIVTHDRHTLDDGSWAAHRNVTVVVRDRDGGGWRRVLTASQLLVPNELLLPGPLLSPAQP
jgi:SnoaL-like domain